MPEQIIIELISDSSRFTFSPAIDQMIKLGQITAADVELFKKQTTAFEKSTAAIQQGAQKSVKSIGDLKKGVDSTVKAFQQGIQDKAVKTVNELATSLKAASDSNLKVVSTTNEVSKAHNSLRQELKQLNAALAQMILNGEEGSAKFQQLVARAGEIKDSMGDAGDAISRAGSDTRNLDHVLDLATGVTAGYTLVTGAASLFGEKNDEVEKTLLKVNSAMAVLQALQQIQDLLTKKNTLSLGALLATRKADTAATVAGTVATEGQAVATGGATIAMRIFNAVMKANPIGLLVTGITAVIAAFAFFSKTAKDNTEELKRNNQAIDDQIEEYKKLRDLQNSLGTASNISQIRTEALLRKNLEHLQNMGAPQAKILEAQIALNKASEDKLANDRSDLITQEHIRQVGEGWIDMLEKTPTTEKLINNLMNERIRTLGNINVLQKRVNKAGEDATEKDKNRLDFLESYSNTLYKRITTLNDADKAAADNQAALEQSFGEKAKLIRENAAKDAIAKAEIVLAHTIESSRAELNAKIGLLQAQSKAELQNLDLTETQRNAIIAKARRQESDLMEAFNLHIQQQELALLKATNDQRIATLAANSDEELKLTLNYLAKDRDLRIKEAKVDAAAKKVIHQEHENAVTNITKDFAKKRAISELEAQKSVIEIQLANATQGSMEELALKQRQIDADIAIEIKAIDERVRLTEEGQRKIEEINNKGRVGKIKLQLDFDLNSVEQLKALQAAINTAEINANQRVLDSVDATYKQRQKAEADLYAARLHSIELDRNAIQEKIRLEEAAAKKILGTDQLTYDQRTAIEKKYTADIVSLNDAADALIEERTQKRIKKIAEQQKQLLADTFEILQRGIDATLDTSAAKTGITSLLNLYQQISDIKKNNNLSEEEKQAAYLTTSIAAAQATITQLFADASARRQEQVQRDLSNLDAVKSKELDNKNLTEQQKANIEEKYRQRAALLKRQAFIAEKNAKEKEAIINGALAIVKAAPNLALMALAALVTAFQVGVIKSTPIPAYAKGTRSAKRGKALVGEQGPEIVEFQGQAWVVGKHRPEVVEMKGGEKIYTYAESKQIAASWSQKNLLPDLPISRSNSLQTSYSSSSTARQIDYDKLGKSVAKHIAKHIPAPISFHNTFDKSGWNQYMQDQGNKTNIKNSRYSS